MKCVSALKYLTVFSLPALVFISFRFAGWLSFLPVIYSFVVIPVLDLVFRPDPTNVSKEEEQILQKNAVYDWLMYSIVPVQLLFVWLFLQSFEHQDFSSVTTIGRIASMGLLCGVLGINVAHELEHRHTKHERFLSKVLLLTSLYMHFFIAHNRGHHKAVSTKEDPASARFGESLYAFWARSVWNSYLSAWSLEAERLRRKQKASFTPENEMICFQIIQTVFLGLSSLCLDGK